MSAPESQTPSTPPAVGGGASAPTGPAKSCSSCGRALIGWGVVSFPCPKCGSLGLGRCAQCRDQSVGYRCRVCDFQGP